MKITASRVDDIIREREAYETDKAKRLDEYDNQVDTWRKAKYNVLNPLREELLHYLERFDLLHFRVDVDDTAKFGRGISVRIQCDEYEKFDDESALSWNLDIELDSDTGDVTKSSGSWSGLKATTEDQLANLQQTVEALKWLNRVDWKTFLNVQIPKFGEYVTLNDPRYDSNDLNRGRDWNLDIAKAAIEDHIGLVPGEYIKTKRGDWIRVDKETSQFYTYSRVPGFYIRNGVAPETVRNAAEYTERIRKDTLASQIDPNNLQVATLDDLIAQLDK